MLITIKASSIAVMIFLFPPQQQQPSETDFVSSPPPQQQAEAGSMDFPPQQEDTGFSVSGSSLFTLQSQPGAARKPAISSGVYTLPELTTLPFTISAGVIMTPDAVI